MVLILCVFISWTKFLPLLQSPLWLGTKKMKEEKKGKKNKEISTSGFLFHRENTNRMSLYVWFCVPWILAGVLRRVKQNKDPLFLSKLNVIYFTAPIMGFWAATLLWWLQGPFSAWKQLFAVLYLGFSMMHLPLCWEGLDEWWEGSASTVHPTLVHTT